MFTLLMARKRYMVRALLALLSLWLLQSSQAINSTSINGQIHLSQTAFDFGDLSTMNIAMIAVLGVVVLVLLVWLIRRRVIRRSRLSSSRAERHDSAGLDGSPSDGNLFARSRPEKTDVVRAIVIGSEHDVDVRFTDEGVSTRHAELLVLRQVDSSPLMPVEPIYYIRDMASARGIEVLRGGDWIQFRADVVLDDERLRIGEVETTAGEINQMAIRSKVEVLTTSESS